LIPDSICKNPIRARLYSGGVVWKSIRRGNPSG